MKKEIDPSIIVGADDYPKSFNVYDILAINIQTMTMDEVNPMLDDYIWALLEDESNKAECNIETKTLYNKFRTMLNEHYYITKIQKYIDRI